MRLREKIQTMSWAVVIPEAVVHVAVGIVFNKQKHVLIAQRPQHAHQGGLWEFPGGKIEENETTLQALKRELFEETGIDVLDAKPLLETYHEYNDKNVLLNVWEVTHYKNEPHGREGQPIRWVPLAELTQFSFPCANQTIVSLLSRQQPF